MFNCLIASLRHPQRHGLRYVVRIGTTRKANRNNYVLEQSARTWVIEAKARAPSWGKAASGYLQICWHACWKLIGRRQIQASSVLTLAACWANALFIVCVLWVLWTIRRGKATSAFLHICFKGVLQMGTQNASPGLLGLDADSLLGKCIVCSLCLVSCVSCVSRVTNWQAS